MRASAAAGGGIRCFQAQQPDQPAHSSNEPSQPCTLFTSSVDVGRLRSILAARAAAHAQSASGSRGGWRWAAASVQRLSLCGLWQHVLGAASRLLAYYCAALEVSSPAPIHRHCSSVSPPSLACRIHIQRFCRSHHRRQYPWSFQKVIRFWFWFLV